MSVCHCQVTVPEGHGANSGTKSLEREFNPAPAWEMAHGLGEWKKVLRDWERGGGGGGGGGVSDGVREREAETELTQIEIG